MTPIDQAAQAHLEANPPPPWWPFPPAAVASIADYFPLVGSHRGEHDSTHQGEPLAAPVQQRPRYRHTDADILAQTFPGDRIADVARRVGCSWDYLKGRRKTSDSDLAAKMDAKRGHAR